MVAPGLSAGAGFESPVSGGAGEHSRRQTCTSPQNTLPSRRFLRNAQGVAIDIIELVTVGWSSALLVGLSDVILDIVESARRLEENGLVVLEEIAPSAPGLS